MATAITTHALLRLAEEAKRRGIQILVEHGTTAHFATSHRNPDVIYRVTAHSCTCDGFLAWGRCTHLAALHAEKGWLPPDDDDDPDPPVSSALPPKPEAPVMPCPVCDHGMETVFTGTPRQRRIRCQTCDGRGVVEIAALITRDSDPWDDPAFAPAA
jgi:hypothetical protein